MTGAGGRAQRGRLHVLCAIFVGVGLVLASRLVHLQVVEHERFVKLAREEHLQTHKIPPKRGDIFDTNHHPLALSVLYESIYVVGSDVRNSLETAATLAPLLEMPVEEVHAKIDLASSVPAALKKQVPAATAMRVWALGLRGIVLQREPVRQYPEGSIAPQLLGFVGRDNVGLAGLEVSYDEELSGTPGLLSSERDTTGQEIALGQRVMIEPVHGSDLVLTIDRVVQRLAERVLAEAVAKNKAIGGQILIMEPSTGSILAMASLPTFSLTDPDFYRPEHDELYKTVPVTNQYEPGSVMKVITMAAGIDEQLVNPSAVVNDTGSIQVGGGVIRNWDHSANGVITMTQVLIKSSNIGSQYVSGLLGPERFYRYMDAFGFGQLTDVRLPGETPGTLRTPATPGWGRIDLATNSYGQGIAVTPIQMLTAVSALANDGILMRPRIVRELRQGEVVHVVQPEPVRQVVSPTTAKTMTDMMVQVLEQPALEQHQIAGYRFAGKTGTADFPTTVGYTSGRTYASIVAFGPLPEPRFSILIRIDAPEALYGGTVAAPVLKTVAQELVTYYRIPARLPARSTRRP